MAESDNKRNMTDSEDAKKPDQNEEQVAKMRLENTRISPCRVCCISSGNKEEPRRTARYASLLFKEIVSDSVNVCSIYLYETQAMEDLSVETVAAV